MTLQPPLPTQQVCISFTDIIDSTSSWDASESTMWAAVRTHHGIIRTQLARFGGYEVKSIGDGFFTCFNAVRPALHFCLAVQNALAQHRWQDSIVAAQAQKDLESGYITHTGSAPNPRGLIVRMGLHWGIPHIVTVDPVMQRRDFYGKVVNESSRIQDEACGDEIAMSDAFLLDLRRVQSSGEISDNEPLTDECRQRILEKEMSIARFEVRSKGERVLKGLGREEHVTIVSLLR